MNSIFRYFSEKSTFSVNIPIKLLLNISKPPIFISKLMKYKRFGKWVFDSVVCLADKDELSSKDSEEK